MNLSYSPARALCGALCLLFPLLGTAEKDGLRAFKAEYEVGNDYVIAGEATVQLKTDPAVDQGWHYHIETQPTGVFKLTGKGHVIEEVHFSELRREDGLLWLLPSDYRYRQDKERQRSIDASFDWNNAKLEFTLGEERRQLDLQSDMVDRLSITLLVPQALFSGLEEFHAPVFDNGRIKPLQFVLEGREVLETAIGPLETIRVRSSNTDGGSREQLTWFAPELGPIPVRIEQFKRNKLVARLSLVKLKRENVPAPTQGQ